MSILCQRLERSLMMALLHEASTALVGVNVFAPVSFKEGVAVHNVNEQAIAGSETFTLNFYCGESEQQVTVPCVCVVAENATEDKDATGNALVDVRCDLMMPGDSESGEDVVSKLEAASVWLHQMVRDSRLGELVTVQHNDITVLGVDPSGFQSSRMVDGRVRVHRYSVRMYCAGFQTVEEE